MGYLEWLDEEYSLFRDAVAATEPSVPVPTCVGWTMDTLVRHLARVYLHKVTLLRTGDWPKDWPPPEPAAEPGLALLARAYRALTAELIARGPEAAAVTWYDPDQTVGFWFRRMVHETVIHRVDAELAAGLPAAHVPDDLAIDGIDEVLTRFLACSSSAAIAGMPGERLAGPDGPETIVVAAGTASWSVQPFRSNEVTVQAGVHGQPQARVEGAPGSLLRWLWGRAGDDEVRVTGNPAWADYLRRMLIAATQ